MRSLPLLLTGACALVFGTAAALEPWADKSLPVTEGVAIWLDATTLNAARAAQQLPKLAEGAPVDAWPDGSGNGRSVVQIADPARPLFRRGAVYFDGNDDFLAAHGRSEPLKEATLFIVAAPKTNTGNYRAFLSANRTGANDYTSGFNIDLGREPGTVFDWLNAEGAGFRGARDLLNDPLPLGAFRVITMQLGTGKEGVRAFLDSNPAGARDRTAAAMHLDQFTIGARCCSNDAKPPFVQGFLDGDIAEVILFSRVLSDDERAKATKYLTAKHARLLQTSPTAEASKPLVLVKDPPPVQMLVPGFSVRELPLALTNIDCLRYRADGTLVAGAYNGRIWLLTDTDSDGLEDKAELYWRSEDLKHVIGMALTPPGDPRGEGVFVATAGRILFIPDKNGDGRGDEQIVIASGWERQKAPGGGGSVDAVGLVVAPDGSLYFGLGTSAYNNAYLLDKEGRANYRLESERGTVLRISPDFSRREIVCTGIRYPLGAAFNRHGDLFMTEQEGATWLPNGNAFDELLHIQPGRHYGFPPRHPRHLPNVLDEPSTFDYGPQHQSTCGIVFNEPVNKGRMFGPNWWADDAFVAGESRGKIWRTKLAKTPAGYVAQTSLVAALPMLTVDVALSPAGDLVVACHSGGPDWGTGPEGAGKLFKISHTTKDAPQPVLAWSSGPGELRVTFDQPLDPARLKNLTKGIEISHGPFVAAGDRFETLRPGYEVVKNQLASPRQQLPVLGATVSADRHSLVLATAALPTASSYAITLRDFTEPKTGTGTLPRHPQIDVATDLSGVTAEWKSADGKETWSGWLPHVDLSVAHTFTAGSAEHARLWELMEKPGTLTLRGQLDLWQMLHPAVQPGAKLDYEPTVEQVTVRVESDRSFILKRDKVPGHSFQPAGRHFLDLRSESREGEWISFEIAFASGSGAPKLEATWSTADDPRPRPFPLRRFLLPWAKSKPEPLVATAKRQLSELEGGNWLRGQKLYYGKATCSVCHTIGGSGGGIGPDLSNLVHRDLETVLRDIREPGVVLNPDHLTYHVTLRDGTEMLAVLLGEEPDKVRLGDATGAVKTLARAEVRSLQPLATSLMPPGLLETLSPAEQRDLLTFLLTTALEPAPITAPNPPEARNRAELDKILGQAAPTPGDATPKPLRLLLAYGMKDHGAGEHDYPLWAERWSKLLGLAENVQVAAHDGWPTAKQFAESDVIVFYSNNPGWTAERKPELDDYIQRGGGAVFIHWAVEGREHAPALADCIGLASNSRTTKYRHGALDLTFPQPDHPITRGFGPTRFVDESYWKLVGDPHGLSILALQTEEGAPTPQLWASERGSGRVFVSIPGHYTWTFDDPLFRLLVLRGICWSAKEPVDRLSELATVGARISR